MTFPATGIPVLSLFILALVISVYLASLRSPHPSTRYLLAGFGFQVLYAGGILASAFGISLSPIVLLSGTLVLWAMVQFCYTFLEQPFGTEYRVVWWITLAAALGSTPVGLLLGADALNLVTTVVMMLLALWAVVVLVRKVRLLAQDDAPGASHLGALLRTRNRSARAQRAVLLPVGVAFSIIFAYVLVLVGLLPGFLYAAWLRVGLLLALVLVAMIQFTYGRDRHSVQIKLVGTALTIVLAVLGIVSMIVIEPMAEPVASVLAGRMALVILSASIVTIVAFPLAYQTSLVGPIDRLLGGIRRVNEGDLAVEVQVLVHDEIGELTDSFNGMTASLSEFANRLEGMVADRTAELQESLRELKAAQARLVEQEKMASLGALTAGIAHEIKNPLNFVNNFSALVVDLVDELRETLDAQSVDAAERRLLLDDLEQNASKVLQHGRRADGIVRSMLMHSRGGGGERRSVDVNELATEYANLAYHGVRAQRSDFNCELQWNLDPAVPAVEGVQQDLGRVFLNIVNNAFYAVAEGNRLNGQHAASVSIHTARVGDAVEIRISDTGPGIPEDVRRRIFEPFFTTKPTGEGTGLGLSMSHDIVVQGHGGTLTVESSEGGGTTFVIALPAATDERPYE